MLNRAIILAAPDGEEGFTTATQMLDAIKAFRQRQADELAAEEAAANEAIKTDPEVKKWVLAAVLENAANN